MNFFRRNTSRREGRGVTENGAPQYGAPPDFPDDRRRPMSSEQARPGQLPHTVHPLPPNNYIPPTNYATQGAQVVQPGFPGGFVRPPPAAVEFDSNESYAWFVAVDQDDSGQVSVEELHNALLNEGNLKFSLDTVKYLMSMFDMDRSGGISFEEFEPLWKYITEWRRTFKEFDTDDDGRIDARELGRALASHNLYVGQSVLDVLVDKYGIRPPTVHHAAHYGTQINLDRFVCACIVVKRMCDLYERCEVGRTEPMSITRDNFLHEVILLP
ncbi:hypothetical protein BC834DRAFT_904511 [Gloeopeniophorella convolvens]|nr:hypothetical protein BC834DRAFT_904511 [Gloeopeniophorella convolvens]